MASSSEYLAVLKASYDYEPQSEDEIAIKEDQLLFLVERVDDDWWKVKLKETPDGEGGLVPAAYVEKADHTSVVKAVYDYDAGAPGELSIKADDVLLVFDKDDDWLLVENEKESGKVGFVPGNYVEESGADVAAEEDEEPPSHASQIVVPPSPPRPVSTYVDPAERVAQTSVSVQADSIQTWAVSEVDKKGKKKKGTLGIGSGAIFFASESDKTPVQKWQTSVIESSHIDKSKHVYIEVGGASPTTLHFNAGSKDIAEAIIEKLDSSKHASTSAASPRSSSPSVGDEQPKLKKNGINVHFASAPPSIISPREPSDDGADGEYQTNGVEDDGDEYVTALYEFTADGDDELSVKEGERLVLLEKDADDWWKVRNDDGVEGVVPAQYVEIDETRSTLNHSSGRAVVAGTSASAREADAAAKAAREAEEQAEQERLEEEQRERDEVERQREVTRKRAEAEGKARAKATAEAAEADRKRKEREQKEREEEKEAQRARRQAEEQKSNASRPPRSTSASGSRPSRSDTKTTDDRPASSRDRNSKSADGKTRPSPHRTRVWHDISGQFSVEAEFIAYANKKLRLHKVNGVVIEVPAAKMSPEDLKYVERVTGKGRGSSPGPPPGALSEDDEPLAVRRRSLQPEPKAQQKPQAAPKKGPSIDWFEFFLGAGCELDDCTRYASAFERDKMDESLLPDITAQTMRSLGLREGDIIRVTKAISQRTGSPSGAKDDASAKELTKHDEDLARQLQAEENGGRAPPKRQTTVSPAPNLFAGPGGQLKNNTRRGRPQAGKNTLPTAVDLESITTASNQINRLGSPTITLTSSPTTVQAPPRSTSAAPVISGFDDDAWTNRPSSTKPLAPTPPAVTARAPSAPPAQSAPPPAPFAPAVAPSVSAPAATANSSTLQTGNSLAQTTESDVFSQLARLSALKTQSPSPAANSAIARSPVSAVSPPPGFQQGLGMGSSPAPLGHLQAQATGFPSFNNGPRGPLAPVPGNQGLLQPLVPTTTGFNSFVPTRPASNPSTFQSSLQRTGFQTSPQPSGFQATQQPSFLSSAPTGFAGMNSQPTGFSSGPLMSQPTGFVGSSPFGGGVPFSVAANRPFGSLPTNPTGFNPGFGQMSPPPPVPPMPPLPPSFANNNNSNANNTTPANIFAQMKSGTFGQDDAPQPGAKYDALRPQPTGWGMQGQTFQNGYSGQYY